ncbi:FMN-linked oxidoreductase [Favolaschia claudopus]|uniref:FMN-linked oxidoreductase n=1 Tax=Favolaschia claudopus TaxID=2862362 RepID=A0AAW0BF33_9AGAR
MSATPAIPKLFTPIQLNSDIQLQHRVVHAPMTRFRVDGETGVILPIVKEYYTQRASTPGTLLISEGTVFAKKGGGVYIPFTPENAGRFTGVAHGAWPGMWSAEQAAAWKEVTQAVHSQNSFIFCQIFGMGRAATPEILDHPDIGKFDLVSASAIPLPGSSIVPRELTTAEVKEYVQLFVESAKNAMSAGFDGVEAHCANGYLVDSFLQDVSNDRTDEYGGSIENRARLILEIVRETARAIGENKVGVRISPWSTFQGMLMDDPIPTFTYLVRTLRDEFPNLAYLHVIEPRISGTDQAALSSQNAHHSNDFIREIWKGKPLISAGGHTRASALEHGERGELVAFARGFLANPDLPVRLLNDISLTKGDRSKYYVNTVEGYTTYPVAGVVSA